jgi:hypothetical protein
MLKIHYYYSFTQLYYFYKCPLRQVSPDLYKETKALSENSYAFSFHVATSLVHMEVYEYIHLYAFYVEIYIQSKWRGLVHKHEMQVI